MRRLFLCFLLISAAVACAQVSGSKKLIVTLGYGPAWSRFRSDSLGDGSTGTTLEFAFDYGIARRWALGLHYQRIGAHRIFDTEQNVRATTYELILSHALIRRERSAFDAMIGLGAGITSFTLKGDRLSSDASGASVSLGARYWKCISPCVGLYGTMWYTGVQSSPLTYADPLLPPGAASPGTVEWHGLQLAMGALVRF